MTDCKSSTDSIAHLVLVHPWFEVNADGLILAWLKLKFFNIAAERRSYFKGNLSRQRPCISDL